MGIAVSFNYGKWLARYPEFSNVLEGQANEFFNEATIYQRNDGNGPINNANVQLTTLNMLVAHIAYLAVGTAAQAASGGGGGGSQVGRIASASQGSESASFELAGSQDAGFISAWAAQTQYGLSWWQATSMFRTAHYRPGPQRRFVNNG